MLPTTTKQQPGIGFSPFQPTERGKLLLNSSASSRPSLSSMLSRRHFSSRSNLLANALARPFAIANIHLRDSDDSALADDILGPLSQGRYTHLPHESDSAAKFLLAALIHEGVAKAFTLENARKATANTHDSSAHSPVSSLSSSFPPDPCFADLAASLTGTRRSYQATLNEFCLRASKYDELYIKSRALDETIIPEDAVSLTRYRGNDLTQFIGLDVCTQSSKDVSSTADKSPVKLDVFLVFDDPSGRVSIDWKEVPKESSTPENPVDQVESPTKTKSPIDIISSLLKCPNPMHGQYQIAENAPQTPLQVLMSELEARPLSSKRGRKDFAGKHEYFDHEFRNRRSGLNVDYSQVIVIADSDNEQATDGTGGDMTFSPTGLEIDNPGVEKESIFDFKSNGKKRRISPRLLNTENQNSPKPASKRKVRSSDDEHSDLTEATHKPPPPKSKILKSLQQQLSISPNSKGRKNPSSSIKKPTPPSTLINGAKTRPVKSGFLSSASKNRATDQEKSDDEEGEDVIERRLRENMRGRRVSFNLSKSPKKRDHRRSKSSLEKQSSKLSQKQMKQKKELEASNYLQVLPTRRSNRRQRTTRSSKAIAESSESDDHHENDQDGDFQPDEEEEYLHVPAPPPEPAVPALTQNMPPADRAAVMRETLPGGPSSQWPANLANASSQGALSFNALVSPLQAQNISVPPTVMPSNNRLSLGLGQTETGSPGSVMELRLVGPRTRLTSSAAPASGQFGKLGAEKLVQAVTCFVKGSSASGSLPTTAMAYPESKFEAQLAEAGTGSPHLSDVEDSGQDKFASIVSVAICRGILGQIHENNAAVKDIDRYDVDVDVNAFYRESRRTKDYAPNDDAGRTLGTQFIVEQQMSRDGPWAYRQHWNRSQEDDTVLAEGGPESVSHQQLTNISVDGQFPSQSPVTAQDDGPHIGTRSRRNVSTRLLRSSRTVKVPGEFEVPSRASRSTRASSGTASGHQHVMNMNRTINVAPIELDGSDQSQGGGMDSGGGEGNLMDDGIGIVIEDGDDVDQELEQGVGEVDDENSEENDDGTPETTRSKRLRARHQAQKAMELQHRVCGSLWDGMSSEVKLRISQWASHDFSWFSDGQDFMEVKLLRSPIECRICLMKGINSANNPCEETIILKLWKDMSWRKLRRLSHHITDSGKI